MKYNKFCIAHKDTEVSKIANRIFSYDQTGKYFISIPYFDCWILFYLCALCVLCVLCGKKFRVFCLAGP